MVRVMYSMDKGVFLGMFASRRGTGWRGLVSTQCLSYRLLGGSWYFFPHLRLWRWMGAEAGPRGKFLDREKVKR